MILMLEASSEIQNQRHKDRNDTQSETWLKGRLTKSLKLKESVKGVKMLKNEAEQDLFNNVDYILKTIGLR